MIAAAKSKPSPLKATSPPRQRVLIFRIGSLGDTCVAIPTLHLIRRRFATAEIKVLTNFPVGGGAKAAPLQAVLGQSGLVDGYFAYPLGLKSWRAIQRLHREIRQWRPDCVINLMPRRSRGQLLRDVLFFRLVLGIPKTVGFSLSGNTQKNIKHSLQPLYEPEAKRLLRNLAVLGDIDLESENAWDLHLQNMELERARRLLENWPGVSRYIACSIGTKWDSNDWGQDRWEQWAAAASRRFPGHGLALIGAGIEAERSDLLAQKWQGPVLNLCGMLSPRESAAVLQAARCYVGHDSGPMHLAAAVATPCVAIFSARGWPGIWFPHGTRHQVIYHQTECAGCRLEVCVKQQKKCIRSITVEEVIEAMQRIFATEVTCAGHEERCVNVIFSGLAN